eukprot:391176-Prorocentrum_minimum.AAC.1
MGAPNIHIGAPNIHIGARRFTHDTLWWWTSIPQRGAKGMGDDRSRRPPHCASPMPFAPLWGISSRPPPQARSRLKSLERTAALPPIRSAPWVGAAGAAGAVHGPPLRPADWGRPRPRPRPRRHTRGTLGDDRSSPDDGDNHTRATPTTPGSPPRHTRGRTRGTTRGRNTWGRTRGAPAAVPGVGSGGPGHPRGLDPAGGTGGWQTRGGGGKPAEATRGAANGVELPVAGRPAGYGRGTGAVAGGGRYPGSPSDKIIKVQ